MINKDDFYLQDIELCKQLEPIMAKKGIDADRIFYLNDKNEFVNLTGTDFIEGKHELLLPLKTWRKDSLEAALPEWVWDFEVSDFTLSFNFPDEVVRPLTLDIRDLMQEGIKRGQESLEALAQLIILLDKEEIC